MTQEITSEQKILALGAGLDEEISILEKEIELKFKKIRILIKELNKTLKQT